MWRGDWIAGFSWIRRDGVFADMPGGPWVYLFAQGGQADRTMVLVQLIYRAAFQKN